MHDHESLLGFSPCVIRKGKYKSISKCEATWWWIYYNNAGHSVGLNFELMSQIYWFRFLFTLGHINHMKQMSEWSEFHFILLCKYYSFQRGNEFHLVQIYFRTWSPIISYFISPDSTKCYLWKIYHRHAPYWSFCFPGFNCNKHKGMCKQIHLAGL